jgi:enoyl-CoA hydratase/carnithine racemase
MVFQQPGGPEFRRGDKMISIDHHGRTAIVKLSRDITNALNPEYIRELADVLQAVKTDSDVRSLVLSSTNDKFFSIGLDIPQLFGLSREDFGVFYRDFHQVCLDLYTLPKPTVAAITGHAIAAGCILTLCCDYRFIAAGRRLLGLNEINLGVPVPYLGDCVLRDLVGTRHAREIMESGEFYPPEESLQMGMVDKVLPLEQVLARSIEKAEALGSLRPEAFSMVKRNRVEVLETRFLTHRAEKEQIFIGHWYSSETRGLLKTAMEKF